MRCSSKHVKNCNVIKTSHHIPSKFWEIGDPTVLRWDCFYSFYSVKNYRGRRGRSRMIVYNYLCNQCISPLTLLVRIPLRRGVLHTTLYDKVCQWFPAGRWFSPGTLVSSTNTTYRQEITEILLKVALNTIALTPLKLHRLLLYVINNQPFGSINYFKYE